MAAAQALAKVSVGSPGGNRGAGSFGRRRGAVSVRLGGSWSWSWRKSPFLGGRMAVGPRRSRNLVASPVQVTRVTRVLSNYIDFNVIFFNFGIVSF
jgi:hypothetical protein